LPLNVAVPVPATVGITLALNLPMRSLSQSAMYRLPC